MVITSGVNGGFVGGPQNSSSPSALCYDQNVVYIIGLIILIETEFNTTKSYNINEISFNSPTNNLLQKIFMSGGAYATTFSGGHKKFLAMALHTAISTWNLLSKPELVPE